MRPILFVLLFFFAGNGSANAQTVYGRSERNSASAGFQGYNFRTDYFLASPASMRDCLVDGCSSNGSNTYYFVARNCQGSIAGSSYLYVVNNSGGLENKLQLSKVVDAMEYYDGILWGIEEYTGQLYQIDIDDGTMILYDNVFKDPAWGINAPFIYSTAMNHDKRILYFTCANGADLQSVYFYQYDMLNRTATRAALPAYTVSFDYAPLNDRAYFVCGASPGQPSGISEYNIAANTLTSVYNANQSLPWDVDVTIDPVKNRLFFTSYQDALSQCITTKFACYRINSRTMDIADVSGRACYMDHMEYLPTDIYDTTWDAFPTDIPNIESATGVQVYPNPASDILYITHASTQDATLYLSDMMGRVVLRGKLQTGKAQLDVSNLATGQYILRIGGNSSRVSIVRW